MRILTVILSLLSEADSIFFEKDMLHVHQVKDILCDPTVIQYTGYFEIGNSNKKYFFWFFESKNDPKNAPTTAWLTGGPGCSSLLALFGENGPCSVSENGESLIPNPYSWNTNSNVFWIDQPPGTGFSLGDFDSGEKEVAEDMINFLHAFFAAMPQYNKDFYLFGESYAGHYLPAIAHRIFTTGGIDLKGVGIGNGLTSPREQYKWYPKMAYNSTTAPQVVTKTEYEAMEASVDTCINLIDLCNLIDSEKNPACAAALLYCETKMMMPYQQHGMNPYDMRLKCEVPGLCYDFSRIGKFLNQDQVQKKIGIDKHVEWEECNMEVNLRFLSDFMKEYEQLIPELLEAGIEILIYAGDQDYICNWLGNKAWVLNLEWSGQEGFNSVKDELYINLTDGSEIGQIRNFKSFTFLQVFQAGHMVPMDQPENALYMFNSFIKKVRINVEEKVADVTEKVTE